MRLPKKFEVFKHPKYKTAVDIRFNSSTGEFSAEYAGTHYHNSSITELRRLVKIAIEQSTKLEWMAVILVKVSHSPSVGGQYTYGAEIQIEHSRFWVANTRGDAGWLICNVWDSVDDGTEEYDCSKPHGFHDPLPRRLNASSWSIPERAAKEGHSPFTLPWESTDKLHSSRWYEGKFIPYTEALWRALEDVASKVDELGSRIDKLLATPKGRAQLVSSSSTLGLPAPKK